MLSHSVFFKIEAMRSMQCDQDCLISLNISRCCSLSYGSRKKQCILSHTELIGLQNPTVPSCADVFVIVTFLKHAAHACLWDMHKRSTHVLYGDVKYVTKVKNCGSLTGCLSSVRESTRRSRTDVSQVLILYPITLVIYVSIPNVHSFIIYVFNILCNYRSFYFFRSENVHVAHVTAG